MMSGRAHGKAILIGEHAVVHGAPAIAMPVGLWLDVRLSAEGGVDLPQPWRRWFASVSQRERGDTWMPSRVEGDLPRGVGLGSSAALGVAALRALCPDIDRNRLIELADESERLFHGNPSGIDVRTVASDAPLRVVRSKRGIETEAIRVGAPLAFDLWIAPIGPSTAEMVRRVSSNLDARDKRERIADASAVVEAAAAALAGSDAAALGTQMYRFHEWLAAAGASSAVLDDLVARAHDAGALGAKLTGGGGGGAVLVLWAKRPAGIELPADVRRFGFTLEASEAASRS